MPTPFPGMDPYLEAPDIWPDVHLMLSAAIRTEVVKHLPKGYVARIDRYVWIDEPDADLPRPLGKPDVFVSEEQQPDRTTPSTTSTLAAPATATVPVQEAKGKPFIKILDAKTHRVVTVIELLSPANKSSGRDRDVYLSKRQEYFRSGTNLVEIDLLRKGLRPPVEGDLPGADYFVIVSRATDYPNVGVWPIKLRELLPNIPVPLAPQLEPVPLPLRHCLDRAYDDAQYANEIDYQQPPQPPLSEADAAWAADLLKP